MGTVWKPARTSCKGNLTAEDVKPRRGKARMDISESNSKLLSKGDLAKLSSVCLFKNRGVRYGGS